MASKLLDIQTDARQLAKIKTKLQNYPPFVIQEGLESVNTFLNNDQFKMSMYPEQSDEPFLWSNRKQQQAYFASNGFGRGIPTKRTYELARSGDFVVQKKYSSIYIAYQNAAPYFKWVQGNFTQIIGHIARGWRPVNTFVVDSSAVIMERFRTGMKGAWERMRS